MVLALVDKKYPELSEIAFRFGIFQRLDYLLHIPIAQMTGDNAFYRRVVRDLRHGWWRAMKNPWLTKRTSVIIHCLPLHRRESGYCIRN